MKLSISRDGTITAIYSDSLAPLIEGAANVAITRASNVEPDQFGQWWATMHASANDRINPGRVFGPFKLRSEALAAEVAYLEARLFPGVVESAAGAGKGCTGL
jgi:hypothetical protein